jgi:hypothetical protein
VLCYELDLSLHIADLESGKTSSHRLTGLTRRSVPSLYWFPESEKFIYECEKEGSICLQMIEMVNKS